MPSKLIEVRSGLFSLLSSFFIRRIFLSLKGVTVVSMYSTREHSHRGKRRVQMYFRKNYTSKCF